MGNQASLVLELQADVLSETASINGICRKATAIAAKLDQKQIEKWLNEEISGYGDSEQIPDYRKIRLSPMFHNPYRGNCPIVVAPAPLRTVFDNYPIGQSILEIGDLLSRNGNEFRINFAAGIEAHLQEQLAESTGINFPVFGITNRTTLVQISERVKSTILNWLLDLERAGVVGEGMSFTSKEKSQAAPASIATVHATNFYGQIATNITNNVALTDDNIAAFIKAVRGSIAGLPDDARKGIDPLLKDLDTVDTKNVGKVRTILSSIKAIAEGTGGNLTATGIIELLKGLL